jgi:hypothetical protein
MWGALDWSNGFQLPSNSSLRDYVFKCFERLYDGYWRDCRSVPADSLITIRYEDFVKHPLETLEQIYQRFGLRLEVPVKENIIAKLVKDSGYRPNEHPVAHDLHQEITGRCRRYGEEFGYDLNPIPVP